MIKLDVVDLVVGLGLEAFENNLILLLADLKFHCVKDRHEPRVGDEAALALVLVLEERLDEESSVAHVPAESLEAALEHFLLCIGQDALRVEDRRSLKLHGLLQRVLLEVLLSEDPLNCLVEVDIVDLGGVLGYGEMPLEDLELLVCQIDLLAIEDTSELLRGNGTLAKEVVVLEELAQSDSVLFNLGLYFEDELLILLFAREGVHLPDIGGLLGFVEGASGPEGVALVNEVHVPDLVLVGAVDLHDGGVFLVRHGEAEVGKSLPELLRGHLEVLVAVPVLEEALRVESVALQPVAEAGKDTLHELALVGVCLRATVEGGGPHVVERGVDGLLEALLGEDLIDGVAKVPPTDMAALFGSPEVVAELLELGAREHDLGHVEADAELGLGDVTAAQLVEVPEELAHSGPLFLAEHTDAGKHVLNVVGPQLNDVGLHLARLGAGVVVEGLVVSATDTEHALVGVDIVAEVDVVDLIGVALVHVVLNDEGEQTLRSEDAELSKDAEELALGDMTTLGDVEVLELGLQVDASVLHGGAVLRDKAFHLVLLLPREVEVLTASSVGVVLGDRLDKCRWVFVDTFNGKGRVDVLGEGRIVEPGVNAILPSKGIELILGQLEV